MPYREPPSAPQDPEVTVATYGAPHEAWLAVLHLENLGIFARTQNEVIIGMAPHLGGGMGGVRVLVRERDAPEAYESLEKLRQELAAERNERRASTTDRQQGSQRWRRPLMLACILFLAVATWNGMQFW